MQRYLRSNGFLSGPWLKPRNAFWQLLNKSGNGRVFRSADPIVGVFLLTGSKKTIVATRSMLFWIDVETMTGVVDDNRHHEK